MNNDNIKSLIKELLSLTNQSEIGDINRMKDIICFLSDKRKKGLIDEKNIKLLNSVLYYASNRLRTFGYNRQNQFQSEEFENSDIDILKNNSVTNYYSTDSGAVLDKLQKEVLDIFYENKNRLFLSAPTSFGKTFLLKEIIFANYKRYNNIVIVLPTVALLMEVSQDLRNFFKRNKMSYTIFTSIYRDLELTEKNVFILTPERVLRLLAIKEQVLPDFIFFDEVYKIDEDISSNDDISNTIDLNSSEKANCKKEHRAVAFRLALYLLMEFEPDCYIAGPFIKLNSIKPGLLTLLKKYNIDAYEAEFEPTLKNKIDYHTAIYKSKSNLNQEGEEIKTNCTKKRDKLSFLITQIGIDCNEPALVYCIYPNYTEKYAREYCNGKAIINDQDIAIFIDHIEKNYNCKFGNDNLYSSTDNWDFLYALKRGIGIHNGKFPKYFQREIMDLFNENKMSLLFCTSTIVEGVNTNAKTIILYNNPYGENKVGKRFLLLNINGRAGRYLRHFIGNIVYLEKKCLDLENAIDISLDFKLFSSEVKLDAIDLENTLDDDLSASNLQLKNNIDLDKSLLPDDVFFQNRLIERQLQENILKKIVESIDEFEGINEVSIINFINKGYFKAILSIWAKSGEIKTEQIDPIFYLAQNYANNGYLGVLKYKFSKYKNEKISEFVNSTYRQVFKNIKDTIEYQLPRIISLFETLINRAFEIKGVVFDKPIDLSHVIRYFEVGASTLVGTDMIENGIPIITVRKIEKEKIEGETLIEQKDSLRKILYKIQFDEYEKKLIINYFKE